MATRTQSRFNFKGNGELSIAKEEWTFSSKNTLDGPHGIHTYVAAMNPHLARDLLLRLSPDGRVLDPFVGGGAVLVEALLNDIPACGLDVNPLAALVSKVKTTHVTARPLLQAYERILSQFSTTDDEPFEFPPGMKIEFWFKPETVRDLSRLRRLVDQIEETPVRDAFRAILSATVRDVSLTYRGEVRLRRLQGKDLSKFSPNVLEKFRERAEVAIRRISALPRLQITQARKGSILASGFGDHEFDAIVCSPPYADDRNGVGYFQFSKNMLFWLGWSEEAVKQDREQFLGHTNGAKRLPPSPTLERVLESIKANPIPSNPRAETECIAFYHDYQVALKEMARVCSGPIAIVIGDRRLSQTFIDNAAVTTELMENVGYNLSRYFYRTIEKKRIPVMKPGGGQRDRSGGGLIDREHTLVYEPRAR